MDQTGKIISNTLAQFGGKFASTTLGVLITILLTRYLGPEGFGRYTFVIVFVTMFGTVADWGLSLITVREASRRTKDAAAIVGNTIVIRFLLAVVAAVAAVVTINLLPYSSEVRMLTSIAAAYLLALSLKTSFQIVFHAKLQMENWALSEVAANLVAIGLIGMMIYNQASLTAIMIAFLIGHLVAAMVAVVLGYRLLPVKLSLVRPDTKYLLLEALPMGTILVVFTIYNRFDTVILSQFHGEEAVGIYGAAYRIFEVLILGAAYFANSLLPLISKYAQNEHQKLREIYEKSFAILLLGGIGVAILTFVLAPVGIMVVAGPEFGGSVTALRILAISLVVSYLNHLNGYTMIALGKQWYSLGIAVAALTVNLGLNFILIPQYSFVAAAWVTFLTEAMIAVLTVGLLHRFIGVTPRLATFRAVPEMVLRRVFRKGLGR